MRRRERETGNSKKSTRLRSKNYPFDDWCKSSICAVASLVCFELATCVFIYIVCDDIRRRDILYIYVHAPMYMKHTGTPSSATLVLVAIQVNPCTTVCT